jgi:NIMA (never in mitosis gene a)-related kinase
MADDPAAGKKFSMADYQIVKVIGEGAYGRAILCKEKSSGQEVVIKEIRLSGLSRKEQNEAKKETEILRRLNHPNIVRCRGSFVHNNSLHIVMDFADGGDLFAQIQKAKNQHFKEDQVLSWFVQICLALKHVHDRKILHRDIKCQNIFLTKAGMVKMGDFGIAKILDQTAQLAKTSIGTPYYLSPEICQGKCYNAKSDVWSLGCVLYELCTLQHAFDSNCMNGLIMKILRAKQSPIPYFYSQNLRTLVDSLLQKAPAKRPSVNEILKLDFVRARISDLLSETVQRIEFSHTVFHGYKGGVTPKNAEPPEKPVVDLPAIPESANPRPPPRRQARPDVAPSAKPLEPVRFTRPPKPEAVPVKPSVGVLKVDPVAPKQDAPPPKADPAPAKPPAAPARPPPVPKVDVPPAKPPSAPKVDPAPARPPAAPKVDPAPERPSSVPKADVPPAKPLAAAPKPEAEPAKPLAVAPKPEAVPAKPPPVAFNVEAAKPPVAARANPASALD